MCMTKLFQGVLAAALLASAGAVSAQGQDMGTAFSYQGQLNRDGVPERLRQSISRTLVDEGFPSAAAAFDTEKKITASDGAAMDRFGNSVATRRLWGPILTTPMGQTPARRTCTGETRAGSTIGAR